MLSVAVYTYCFFIYDIYDTRLICCDTQREELRNVVIRQCDIIQITRRVVNKLLKDFGLLEQFLPPHLEFIDGVATTHEARLAYVSFIERLDKPQPRAKSGKLAIGTQDEMHKLLHKKYKLKVNYNKPEYWGDTLFAEWMQEIEMYAQWVLFKIILKLENEKTHSNDNKNNNSNTKDKKKQEFVNQTIVLGNGSCHYYIKDGTMDNYLDYSVITKDQFNAILSFLKKTVLCCCWCYTVRVFVELCLHS